MRINLRFVAFALALSSCPAVADPVCPDIQTQVPDQPGLNYLLACYEYPGLSEADLPAFRDRIAAAPVEMTPRDFSSFRDAPGFDWKRPIIVWNKQRISTQPHAGYVVTRKGERYEGPISFKLVQGEIDEFYVPDGKKDKKLKAKDVKSFGVVPDDYDAAIGSMFGAGTLTFPDGVMWTGEARFISTDRMLWRGENGRVVQLTPGDIARYSLVHDDKTEQFISSQGYFARTVADGDAYTLAVNPHPQVKKEKSKAKSFFKSMLVDAATSAVAQGVAHGVFASGGSLDAAIVSAELAGGISQAYLTGPEQLRNEFLLVDKSSGDTWLVHPDNLAEVFEPRLAKCASYSGMKISEQIELVKIENIEKLTGILNDCGA